MLTVAVATSVDDAGLMRVLNRAFEDDTGIWMRTIPRGSGAAIRLAREGDVDAVIAHAPHLETALLAEGYGMGRWPIMVNSFLVLGPSNDPAGITTSDGTLDAFERIGTEAVPFVSRGDGSGTHHRERAIWAQLALEPARPWYFDVGQGMAATLFVADQVGAYTLADQATARTAGSPRDLRTFVGGDITDDPWLENRYSVIVVDPARHPTVAHDLALGYVDFLTGAEGQAIIAEHAHNGDRLFFANDEWAPTPGEGAA